jgi:hypothetical protein
VGGQHGQQDQDCGKVVDGIREYGRDAGDGQQREQ